MQEAMERNKAIAGQAKLHLLLQWRVSEEVGPVTDDKITFFTSPFLCFHFEKLLFQLRHLLLLSPEEVRL